MGFRFHKVVWSPVEIEWLKEHRNDTPMNQLSVSLSKTRNAIERKLKEIDGKPVNGKQNKKSIIGKRPDLGVFVRSAWEANFLRFLNYSNKKWIYEPKVFFFEKEKRGAISYLPDIYLPDEDTYIEIKGFLDSKGRSAIKKFKRYYPEEFKKLKAVTGSLSTKATKFFKDMGVEVVYFMSELNKNYKNKIPNWE